MFSISFPPIESEIIEFARKWTEKLAGEDYKAAHEMLRYVAEHPGRSWAHTPNDLRSWISNYGSDTPIDDEPSYVVTSISTAAGDRWDNYLDLKPANEHYSGYVGRLDWWLPLNGEWSDLQASFDLIKVGSCVAFVLVALRVP